MLYHIVKIFKVPIPNCVFVEEVPAGTVKDESEALVMALRNVFMPRLSDRDASIFSTLIQDLWPCAEVPMVFQGQGEEKPLIDNRPESSLSASTQPDSRTLISGRKSKNESQTKLYRGESICQTYVKCKIL